MTLILINKFKQEKKRVITTPRSKCPCSGHTGTIWVLCLVSKAPSISEQAAQRLVLVPGIYSILTHMLYHSQPHRLPILFKPRWQRHPRTRKTLTKWSDSGLNVFQNFMQPLRESNVIKIGENVINPSIFKKILKEKQSAEIVGDLLSKTFRGNKHFSTSSITFANPFGPY